MSVKIENEESKPVNNELAEQDLNSVSGGAIPTPVNGQITDAIT